uniref:F-box domain-containing protein n=1 Tax=Emiliania huxleyi TaxID=2903 RepID=A0A7S3RWA1_EMIHU|mmetsp:Transcript_8174/g.24062  ORF Transcript_8174/g.24062 Transcript_8174/m.24062 type:complete len:430 (-) Transcript_8174:218-1507(-)
MAETQHPLHPDILLPTFEALGLQHALRAAAVCSAWRLAASELRRMWTEVRVEGARGVGGNAILGHCSLGEAAGVCVAPDGSVWVSDSRHRRVVNLSQAELGFVRSVGCPDHPPVRSVEACSPRRLRADALHVCCPMGAVRAVACDGGSAVYVCEVDRSRVRRIRLSDGAVLASTSPLSLSCPQSLALAAADEEGGAPRVYVADTQNDRVRVFDGDLRPDSKRRFSRRVARPWSLACSREELFVCEYYECRVAVFSLGGDFLRSFGAPGTAPGRFAGPSSVAVGEGRGGDLLVFVAESGEAGLGHQRRLLPSRVQVLTAQGEPRCITLLGAAADSAADAELDTAAADAIVQPALDRATGAAAAAVLRAPVGGGERRRRRSPEPRLWGIAVTAERVIVSTSGALCELVRGAPPGRGAAGRLRTGPIPVPAG